MQQQLPELDKKTKLCAVSLCHFPESDKQSFCGGLALGKGGAGCNCFSEGGRILFRSDNTSKPHK